MKAVILCAGKSTRTYPLTLTKPKPLLKIANKTLLEHNLDQIIDLVSEIILIVGYKKEMIQNYFGNAYKKIPITYVEQTEQLGTGHAILQAKPYVSESFLVLMGDDLYDKTDLTKLTEHDNAVLAKQVENWQHFGVFVVENDLVKNVVEKPNEFISDLANVACYHFQPTIFDLIENVAPSSRGEIEITDAMLALAKKSDLFCVRATFWIPIGYPHQLWSAAQTITSKESIGENTIISGSAMKSSIGSNCVIDGTVENCIIGDNCEIRKGSVLKNSVLGDNIQFLGTTEAKENQFCCAIGDNCDLSQVTIKEGSLIWPNKTIKNETIDGTYQ